MMDDAACLSTLTAAQKAYDNGRGEWPTLHVLYPFFMLLHPSRSFLVFTGLF